MAIGSDLAATTRPDLQPARGYKKKRRKALKTVVKSNKKSYGKKWSAKKTSKEGKR